jgi:uncharacterized protein YhhL (DUF1145 family)
MISDLTLIETQLAILVIAFVLITLIHAFQIGRLQSQVEKLQAQLAEHRSMLFELALQRTDD